MRRGKARRRSGTACWAKRRGGSGAVGIIRVGRRGARGGPGGLAQRADPRRWGPLDLVPGSGALRGAARGGGACTTPVSIPCRRGQSAPTSRRAQSARCQVREFRRGLAESPPGPPRCARLTRLSAPRRALSPRRRSPNAAAPSARGNIARGQRPVHPTGHPAIFPLSSQPLLAVARPRISFHEQLPQQHPAGKRNSPGSRLHLRARHLWAGFEAAPCGSACARTVSWRRRRRRRSSHLALRRSPSPLPAPPPLEAAAPPTRREATPERLITENTHRGPEGH